MTQGSIAERLVGVAKAFMGKTLRSRSGDHCRVSSLQPSPVRLVTVIAVGGIMFPMDAGSVSRKLLCRRRSHLLVRWNYYSSIGTHDHLRDCHLCLPACTLSPNDLFLAGVLPGLFIAMVLVVYLAKRPGRAGLDIQQPEFDGG